MESSRASTSLNVGAKGHINSASALGTWPEGQALVEGLIEAVEDSERASKHQLDRSPAPVRTAPPVATTLRIASGYRSAT